MERSADTPVDLGFGILERSADTLLSASPPAAIRLAVTNAYPLTDYKPKASGCKLETGS